MVYVFLLIWSAYIFYNTYQPLFLTKIGDSMAIVFVTAPLYLKRSNAIFMEIELLYDSNSDNKLQVMFKKHIVFVTARSPSEQQNSK